MNNNKSETAKRRRKFSNWSTLGPVWGESRALCVISQSKSFRSELIQPQKSWLSNEQSPGCLLHGALLMATSSISKYQRHTFHSNNIYQIESLWNQSSLKFILAKIERDASNNSVYFVYSFGISNSFLIQSSIIELPFAFEMIIMKSFKLFLMIKRFC